MVGPVHQKQTPSKRNTTSENRTTDKHKRRKTSVKTTAVPVTPAPAPVTSVNPYKKYAEFPWGSKEFNPDIEFRGGRKVWGTSTNPHTRKIRETQKRLLGPLLAFERAKDWKRQKVNRALKAGVAESEHATVTGAPIGTKRNQLSDVQRGKFERLVQKTWEVMLVRKKAYILHCWYGLSQVQQRFYLELGEGDNIPVFTIPEGDLEETGTKPVNEFSVVVSVEPISRQAYARFEGPIEQLHAQDDTIAIADRIIQEMEIAEGGAEDCLSDVVEDIEPDSEDESDGQGVTEPTTITEVTTATESTTVTESTTITEPTTVTVPTTVTDSTTVTEPTTITEPTTVTVPTTATVPTTITVTTTVTRHTTTTATVTVTPSPVICNSQPVLNSGFEQSEPAVWFYTSSNAAASSGIQADADSYEGKNDFLGRGTTASNAWSLTLHQTNIHVCPGRYILTANHQQDDASNCLVQWYIDDVMVVEGKPGKDWGALSAPWTPAAGQTTVELKGVMACVKGGNSGKILTDMVTLALQPLIT